MKPTKYIMGLVALSLASSATAANVTVHVTGATAFRSAALAAILSKYAAGNGSISFKYAHDSTTGLGNSTRSIFSGNFQGNPGTTTIVCTFSGSVEGIRALKFPPGVGPNLDPGAPTYLDPTDAQFVAAASGNTAAGIEYAGAAYTALTFAPAALNTVSDIAFSDVNVASTPFSATGLVTDQAGVIVFTMIANEGSTLSNVTNQQYRALLSLGYQPKSLFTGDPNDTTYVFAVGRNDTSGTRTTALAETGYGITKPVFQYLTNATSGNTITGLRLAPTTGSDISTIWGQNVVGNGGYNSGGNLVGPMGLTTAATTVFESNGSTVAFTADQIELLTWLAVTDASTAKNNGAVLCDYNGVGLDLDTVTLTSRTATQMAVNTNYTITAQGNSDFTLHGAPNNTVGTTFRATSVGVGTGTVSLASFSLSLTDKDKLINGSYTAWGYERMFRTTATTNTDKQVIYNGILGALPANIGTAGLTIGEMAVGRSADGGIVAPLN